MNQSAHINDNKNRPVLHVAFELANKKWKLGFTDAFSGKVFIRNIDAGDVLQLSELFAKARKRFLLPDDARITSCYEAGRDGFWLHRHLLSIGVENIIIDPSSIEVPRRKRRAKTDKLDVRKMLSMLLRHCSGERKVFSIVRAPDPETEDMRRVGRELNRLKHERTMHTNRISSLLVAHNIREVRVGADFAELLEELIDYEGRPVRPYLKSELLRVHQRWLLVVQQIKELEGERAQLIETEDSPMLEMARRLKKLKGIGDDLAWTLTLEMFGWREFKNRKEVGAFVGMTGTPYNSGDIERDQGISKSGSRMLRAKIVQMSWLWLINQPKSKQAKWFNERFASGGSRVRKVGIVALGRRLLVELWHYLEHGSIPEGAIMS